MGVLDREEKKRTHCRISLLKLDGDAWCGTIKQACAGRFSRLSVARSCALANRRGRLV